MPRSTSRGTRAAPKGRNRKLEKKARNPAAIPPPRVPRKAMANVSPNSQGTPSFSRENSRERSGVKSPRIMARQKAFPRPQPDASRARAVFQSRFSISSYPSRVITPKVLKVRARVPARVPSPTKKVHRRARIKAGTVRSSWIKQRKGTRIQGWGSVRRLPRTAPRRPSRLPRKEPARDMRTVPRRGPAASWKNPPSGGTMARAMSKNRLPRSSNSSRLKPVSARETAVIPSTRIQTVLFFMTPSCTAA